MQTNTYHMICKQNNLLQTTHLHEAYEVEMLQSIRNIPSNRSQRIAETNQTIGTTWMTVSVYCPQPVVINFFCPKQEPSHLEVVGTSKILTHNVCKAYG
jgi:hypothetical protein